MIKKHLHVKLSAESILEMIAEVACSAHKKGIEENFLWEDEYKEIIHSDSQDLHTLIKENLYGTVECKLLETMKLIKAYFEARNIDDDLLRVMLDKSRD